MGIGSSFAPRSDQIFTIRYVLGFCVVSFSYAQSVCQIFRNSLLKSSQISFGLLKQDSLSVISCVESMCFKSWCACTKVSWNAHSHMRNITFFLHSEIQWNTTSLYSFGWTSQECAKGHFLFIYGPIYPVVCVSSSSSHYSNWMYNQWFGDCLVKLAENISRCVFITLQYAQIEMRNGNTSNSQKLPCISINFSRLPEV